MSETPASTSSIPATPAATPEVTHTSPNNEQSPAVLGNPLEISPEQRQEKNALLDTFAESNKADPSGAITALAEGEQPPLESLYAGLLPLKASSLENQTFQSDAFTEKLPDSGLSLIEQQRLLARLNENERTDPVFMKAVNEKMKQGGTIQNKDQADQFVEEIRSQQADQVSQSKIEEGSISDGAFRVAENEPIEGEFKEVDSPNTKTAVSISEPPRHEDIQTIIVDSTDVEERVAKIKANRGEQSEATNTPAETPTASSQQVLDAYSTRIEQMKQQQETGQEENKQQSNGRAEQSQSQNEQTPEQQRAAFAEILKNAGFTPEEQAKAMDAFTKAQKSGKGAEILQQAKKYMSKPTTAVSPEAEAQMLGEQATQVLDKAKEVLALPEAVSGLSPDEKQQGEQAKENIEVARKKGDWKKVAFWILIISLIIVGVPTVGGLMAVSAAGNQRR